jgi:hypothetical protein
MSRIYFDSEHDRAEVLGSERAYMDRMTSHIGVIPLLSMCKSWTNDPPLIMGCIPNGHSLINFYRRCPEDFTDAFERFCTNPPYNNVLIVDGKEYDVGDIILNTAMSSGSDPVKLYARIHGSCETHGYVEGANRAWIASIIENGLETSVYRQNVGWDNVVELLKSEDQSPVVMSYSVCDEFPDGRNLGYGDEWYDMEASEHWKIAINELRTHVSRELRPDAWDNYRFSSDMNSFKVVEYLVSGRIRHNRWGY